MGDRRTQELSLRAVAALAEKLADGLRNGSLWEGEYSTAFAEIARHIEAAQPDQRRQ